MRDTLKIASDFLRCRQFDKAARLLQSREDVYEGNFDFYLMLGTSFLYLDDLGSASLYYKKARTIKIVNTDLQLGQAAIFLIRGDTDKAITYYLEILDNEPENKIAKNAMEFIRTSGDFSTICKWRDTGKIKQFFPPLGINPHQIMKIVFPIVACVLGCLCVLFVYSRINKALQVRPDLRQFMLTVDDKKIITESKIDKSYSDALVFISNNQDNLAQIEVNKILLSDADVKIKQKARRLMDFIWTVPPTFDNLKNAVDYETFAKEPQLYLDCYTVWGGRIANFLPEENAYYFDLLQGYETKIKFNAIVRVKLTDNLVPLIENDKAIKILGKISTENGNLCLEAVSIFQSVKE